jgi:hypothetical protein
VSSEPALRRLGWQIGPGGQMADRLPDLPIRNGKVELRLKVEPELGIGAKPVAEPQGRVAGDRALAGDDLADAVRRHVDLSCEFSGRNAKPAQLVLQNTARMHSTFEHGVVSLHRW